MEEPFEAVLALVAVVRALTFVEALDGRFGDDRDVFEVAHRPSSGPRCLPQGTLNFVNSPEGVGVRSMFLFAEMTTRVLVKSLDGEGMVRGSETCLPLDMD